MKTYLTLCLTILGLVLLSGCIELSQTLVIELNPGLDTVDINGHFEDAGATAAIGRRTITVTIIENTVDLTVLGTYRISYQAVDLDQTVTITRIVTVIDETPPVLSLNPGIDTVEAGSDWVDAGVSATDNSNGTISIVVTGEVDTTTPGENAIVYTATDESGNRATITRYVHVIDNS